MHLKNSGQQPSYTFAVTNLLPWNKLSQFIFVTSCTNHAFHGFLFTCCPLEWWSPNFGPRVGSGKGRKLSVLWAVLFCRVAAAFWMWSAQKDALGNCIIPSIYKQSQLGQRTLDMTVQSDCQWRLQLKSNMIEQILLLAAGTLCRDAAVCSLETSALKYNLLFPSSTVVMCVFCTFHPLNPFHSQIVVLFEINIAYNIFIY